MKRTAAPFVFVAVCVLLGIVPSSAAAGTTEPDGVIAVSAGNQVEIIAPGTGAVTSFKAGPVGWLYPAPGGLLFAPDLIHGRTLVIDLKHLRSSGILKGVTMPHFGADVADRYVTVAGDVMVFSYPERAELARVEAHILRPWQVVISKDWSTLFILERTPGMTAQPVLWIIDLPNRDVLRKVPLDPGVTSMAFSRSLGVLAFADGSAGVRLSDPTTLVTIRRLQPGGRVNDVTFTDEGTTLLAAVAHEHAGAVESYRLKFKRKGLHVSRRHAVELDAVPLRLAAAPGGTWAAAGTNGPGLSLFRIGHRGVVHTVPLPASPRDVEWCDANRRGPLLPAWSNLK